MRLKWEGEMWFREGNGLKQLEVVVGGGAHGYDELSLSVGREEGDVIVYHRRGFGGLAKMPKSKDRQLWGVMY